ncbi:MAG: hypothetical protein M1812_001872 [Candelaria pacifica]|nr:MAG: hypothetical protein M1812_001872 [Candelaria pacifica]
MPGHGTPHPIYADTGSASQYSASMYGQQNATYSSSARSQQHPQTPSPLARDDAASFRMAALQHALGGIGLNGLSSIDNLGLGTSTLPMTPAVLPGAGLAHPIGTLSVRPNGQVVVSPLYAPQSGVQSQASMHQSISSQSPGPLQYLAQPNYASHLYGQQLMPFPAHTQGWAQPSSDLNGKEVPSLVSRRNSLSSNEENAPGTPFFGSASHGDHHPGIAVAERSPIDGYSHSTPSPQHYYQPYGVQSTFKGSGDPRYFMDINRLVRQHPVIPHPVPAIFTPTGSRSLEMSLRNHHNNNNVYIRGLPQETNDSTLIAYAERFGAIQSAKAIINHETGFCKGFGFVRYYTYDDAENCVRGFFHLGYEVSFAKESFNARLKSLADLDSTNLYVSNLPREMNEAELGGVFIDYKVESSKILRDPITGQSRGVGFARFETREICDEIIAKFHGTSMGQEKLPLQVRYADTTGQKMLKTDATNRRQYKAAEYDVGVRGVDGYHPSPTQLIDQLAPRLAHTPTHGNTGAWSTGSFRSTSDTGSHSILGQRISGRGAGNWVASRVEADRSRAPRRSHSPMISLGQTSTSDIELQASVEPKTHCAPVAESVCSISEDDGQTCTPTLPIIACGDTY